jgi:DNA-binding transcriptional LysR family regulator
MDWRHIAFDWNQTRAFLATVEEGSLSAAARALGVAQPTLGRQVAALEQELGVTLFQRVGRGLSLTPSGLELVDHARAMADAASLVSLAASGQSHSIEGSVCISASEAVAVFALPRILAKLRDIAPAIEIEIVATGSVSDLRRREADIAVRHFRPTQQDLITRKLMELPAWLYAAPSYLDLIGHPATPADFSRANFVGFGGSDRLISGLKTFGFALTQRNFKLMAESELVRWEMVKQGLGIGVITEDVGGREPLVQKALPTMAPIMVPLWLTTHRELHTSRRIRVVYDLLASELVRG